MTRRFLNLLGALLAACVIAPPTQPVEAAGPSYPAHVNATMSSVLAQAHKAWRRDAIVWPIVMQWYPNPESPQSQYWLAISLYSPSNGARRSIQVGGPNDGDIQDASLPWNPKERPLEIAIPEFKLDLPEAIALIRRAGLKDSLNSLELRMVGAAHTTPLAAWMIATRSAKSLYPIPIDAQTGAVIPWQRAFDPPQWTDAQMKAAWDRVLNRNQPANKPYDPYAREPGECVIEIIQVGHC